MKKIPLTQGKFTLVDDCDFGYLSRFRWYAWKSNQSKTFYARCYARDSGAKDQVKLYMHRLVLPGVREVDHINGNGLDNQLHNLRPATRSEQMHNLKRRSDNTSGFKGVSASRSGKRWYARCKRKYLGRFATPIQAARAYDIAAIAMFGSFARLNFPKRKAS